MRRSEVLALQWGDVDLDVGRIVVRRPITHTPASGIVIGRTKTGTKGYRVISVGASVVDELKVHKVVQEAAAKSNTLPAPVWVFTHDAGVSPWRPRTPPIPLRRPGRWKAVSNWMVESAEASLTALASAPRCRIEKRMRSTGWYAAIYRRLRVGPKRACEPPISGDFAIPVARCAERSQ
jgi:hypothetical protein